jgi:hypothetical protein
LPAVASALLSATNSHTVDADTDECIRHARRRLAGFCFGDDPRAGRDASPLNAHDRLSQTGRSAAVGTVVVMTRMRPGKIRAATTRAKSMVIPVVRFQQRRRSPGSCST